MGDGARLAAERRPDVIVFDGSGTAIPPVAADRRVLVVGPGHDLDAHFNTYRRLVSDLVIAVGCEAEGAVSAAAPAPPARAARREGGGVHGRARRGTAISRRTSSTSRRASATARRSAASSRRLDADTYLTELKGAAIDLVAEDALARGRRVVLAANDVVAPGLDEALLALVPEAVTA